jgi:archaellum component FlaC
LPAAGCQQPVLTAGSALGGQRTVNIDERLEKLTQRHETLTQTVEVIAREMQGLQSYVKDIAEGTARLLHIAQIHEHRITRLEEDGSTD